MAHILPGLPAIVISGYWRGDDGTTRRYFSGQVLTSDHPDVPQGEYVVVTYQCPEQRIVPRDVHGHYVLKLRGLAFPLVSFLCEALRHPGQNDCQRHDRPTQWSALAISGARPVEEPAPPVRSRKGKPLRLPGT